MNPYEVPLSSTPAPYRDRHSEAAYLLARYNRHVTYLIDKGLSRVKFIAWAVAVGVEYNIAGRIYKAATNMVTATQVNRDIEDEARAPAAFMDTSGDTVFQGTCRPPSGEVHGPVNKKSRMDDVLGSEFCVQQDVQNLRPVVMKVGKSINVAKQRSQSIANMLKHASGYGTIVTEFNGWLNSKVGMRANTFLCFRHNFSDDSATTAVDVDYPTGSKILTPIPGDDPSNIPGIGLTSEDIHNGNPWHHHPDGSTFFAPLNRADYEDMSWNLNRLKFKGEGSGQSSVTVSEAPGKAYSKMRRVSLLRQNNASVHADVTNPESTYVPLPYDYDMVFNQGTVTFDFSNKGNGACHTTVIVFKVKKSNIASVNHADWIPPATGSANYGVAKTLYPAIEQGVKDQQNSKQGLNNLGGQYQPSIDVLTNPEKPLFPQSRHTLQSNLPYKEESRMKFAMPAGARRTLTLQLGGDVYDPAQLPRKTPAVNNIETSLVPIVDTHSFIVCISVNGLKATRIYGAHSDRLGEIIPDARIEWQAKYSESIGGCSYKNDKNNRIQVRGEVHDLTGATGRVLVANENAGVILPLSSVIGTPGNRILHAGDKISSS